MEDGVGWRWYISEDSTGKPHDPSPLSTYALWHDVICEEVGDILRLLTNKFHDP